VFTVGSFVFSTTSTVKPLSNLNVAGLSNCMVGAGPASGATALKSTSGAVTVFGPPHATNSIDNTKN